MNQNLQWNDLNGFEMINQYFINFTTRYFILFEKNSSENANFVVCLVFFTCLIPKYCNKNYI